MPKLSLALTIVAALAMCGPANAQQVQVRHYGTQHFRSSIRDQIERLGDRIERAYDDRQISRWQARVLLRRYQELRRLERQYSRGGLDSDERLELKRRVFQLRQRLAWAVDDWWGDPDREGDWEDPNDRNEWEEFDDPRNGPFDPK